MNIKLKLILGISGIFITIFLWSVFVVGELHKMPTDYEIILEQEGNDRVLNTIGGELSDPFQLREIFRVKVVNVEGSVLEIYSTVVGKDSATGEIIFDSTVTYFVDRDTRKHVKEVEGYFSFPQNVKKQNYELFHSIVLGPATFVFERVETINDLEVYIFSCESLGNDVSYAYQKFEPKKIMYDGRCRTAIEPVTGSTISFELDWDNYFVEDGVRGDQVEFGDKKSTEYSQFDLIEHAKTLKQVYFLYETIIPVLIGGILSSIFIGIIILNEKIKSDFLNRQKTTKLEKDVMTERLTAIGNLASRLAHDLRNPLSVISNDFSIMKRKHPELDKDSVRRIERGIDRIDHQVQSVMDFIKLKPSRLENHSALEILESVLDTLSIQKNIKVNLTDNNSQIFCDKEQCEILFYNLIFNAVQELEEKGGTISIRIIEQDNSIIIEFEDSGLGIPKENLEKIFDPLFTTKQRGTGLGLASCKNIMEQFGGKISVKTNPTTFTLVFQRKMKTVKNYSGKKN